MISGISHIALNVADMDKSLHFYCNVLGFTVAFELCNDKGEPWIKYIKAGKSQFIELFYNRKGENTAGSFSHVCFEVDDIQKTAENLRAHNINVDSGPSKGKDFNWQCWAKDPDGNRIEFMQLSPDSPQAKAIGNLK
jgi:lactoylglutathione lyase